MDQTDAEAMVQRAESLIADGVMLLRSICGERIARDITKDVLKHTLEQARDGTQVTNVPKSIH